MVDIKYEYEYEYEYLGKYPIEVPTIPTHVCDNVNVILYLQEECY